MSATVWSKYACSRASRYCPSGVPNQSASVVDSGASGPEDASMVAIIPIPAFTDNYIWLLRDGRAAVVVDPGDAAPVLAYLAAHGLALTAILATHHHGDHVGGVAALLERFPVPVFGPARERIPGPHARGRGRRPHRRAGTAGHAAPSSTSRATRRGTSRTSARSTGCRPCSAATRCSPAGCGRLFEGTPAQMWASLSALAALPPATRVYCGHEYTLANLRFAQAVEPHNPDAARRGRRATRPSASAASPRCRRRSDSSARPIRSCASRRPMCAHRRSAMRGSRCPTTSRRLPRCARGRTCSRRFPAILRGRRRTCL